MIPKDLTYLSRARMRLRAVVLAAFAALAASIVPAQEAVPAAAPADAPTPQAQPTQQTQTVQEAAPAQPDRPTLRAAEPFVLAADGLQNEEQIRHLLLGRSLYLRGNYLDNNLTFNEHGKLVGHSPQGSYTLSAIEIERVRLLKHKLELEGARYGLHFVGQLAFEDPSTAFDRVRITPKKKSVRITIDREQLVSPKKQKDKKAKHPQPEKTEEQQVQDEIAAAPEAERPADKGSITTTSNPVHAARMLQEAIDAVFAPGLDERMLSAMPDFWKLYYRSAQAGTDYRPSDAAVLRQNAVEKKARLLGSFEPSSNEYAQEAGVAGMALYHVVIGADGAPGEIAVARPIGFGLDESAVESIRKAKFEAAQKDGKPVSVLLDLIVQFRIYSGLTAPRPASPETSPQKPPANAEPVLPGPYSVPR
jgi:outer membrane biosynthesis protein TonB